MKMTQLKQSAQVVQELIHQKGYDNEVIELPASTRTAQEAANALDCKVDQIAKTIVFKLRNTGEALLVVASGSNRINEKRVSEYIGDRLDKADAIFVKEKTGYVIGGVSPVVKEETLKIVIDEDILQYDEIWAAAGHPKAVFQLTPEQLLTLAGGEVIEI